jgi:hypothetical protein
VIKRTNNYHCPNALGDRKYLRERERSRINIYRMLSAATAKRRPRCSRRGYAALSQRLVQFQRPLARARAREPSLPPLPFPPRPKLPREREREAETRNAYYYSSRYRVVAARRRRAFPHSAGSEWALSGLNFALPRGRRG